MTPWTVAHQAPLSMGFSKQEYWSGLPFPSPGDLPDPGIEPRSPALQTDALPTEQQEKPAVSELSCSVVSDSATPWTAALQAFLSIGILQARILESVAMPSSRGSS